MESAEIRRRWLRFFESRGHTVVPSASLIADDPTLLLVNAGMVQFKPYFLGDAPAPYPRATSVQKRVQRRGVEDNYWHMGVPGPGGPCSEIYFDRGPEHGREGGPIADEERYLEVWNLVFMEYELSQVRSKEDFDVAGELPAKNIDTGLGLERMAAILQGVDNIYEIDTTRQILDRATELTDSKYG